MTIKQLKRLHALNKEIEYEKARLVSLKARNGITQLFDGICVKKSDFSSDIDLLEAQITAHLKECIALYKEILAFVNAIPDPLIRLAVSLKYINGLEWDQVASHIGGGNTADAVRKGCERFLKQHLSK